MFQDFRNRWDRQSRAFYNLFRQADRVERLAEIIQRLVFIENSLMYSYVSLIVKLMFLIYLIQEQGDLKLRVRTLESERAFQRVAAVQRTVGNVSLADFSSTLRGFFFSSDFDNCTNNQFVPFWVLYGFINYKEQNLWNMEGYWALGLPRSRSPKQGKKIKQTKVAR